MISRLRFKQGLPKLYIRAAIENSGREHVSVEFIANQLRLPHWAVQEAFHRLNLEGFMTKAYRTLMPCCEAADCPGNWNRYWIRPHKPDGWPWVSLSPRKKRRQAMRYA